MITLTIKKQGQLLLPRGFSRHFVVNKEQSKSYSKKTCSYVSSVNPFINLFYGHTDFLSNRTAKYKNSIVPPSLTVKSKKDEETNIAKKDAAAMSVEKEEYTLND